MKVIETMLPDGPHWYAGIRRQERPGALIQGPEWSPYWEDRKELNDAQAHIVYETVCKSMPGAHIVQVDKAMYKDAWRLLENGKHYEIKAKYMSKGLIVSLPGYTPKFYVVAVKDKEFVLNRQQSHENNDCVFIGRNSNRKVIVIGKVKTKEVDA